MRKFIFSLLIVIGGLTIHLPAQVVMVDTAYMVKRVDTVWVHDTIWVNENLPPVRFNYCYYPTAVYLEDCNWYSYEPIPRFIERTYVNLPLTYPYRPIIIDNDRPLRIDPREPPRVPFIHPMTPPGPPIRPPRSRPEARPLPLPRRSIGPSGPVQGRPSEPMSRPMAAPSTKRP